jgi:hypothetical protein
VTLNLEHPTLLIDERRAARESGAIVLRIRTLGVARS